jgi:hypothetical protein
MNTYYFSSLSGSLISPLFSPYWGNTNYANRYNIVKNTGESALVSSYFTTTGGQYFTNYLSHQYIHLIANNTNSPTGIFSGQLKTDQFFKFAHLTGLICMYAVNHSGARKTSLNYGSCVYENGVNAFINRSFTGIYNNFTGVVSGDYLVVEIGANRGDTGTTQFTGAFEFGTNGSGDLPIDILDRSQLNSWIRFNPDIQL